MKRGLAIGIPVFLTASLFAGLAFATGTIFCKSASGASISLQLGFVAVDEIIGAYIEADGQSWSTSQGEAGPLSILQGFVANDRVLVDFGDENLENIIARVRLFHADDKVGQATAGTLEIAGVGVYPVVCQGP